jgi:hypothetical protein
MSNTKYPALSLISKVFKFFGWVNILVAVACVLYGLTQGAPVVFFVALGTLFSALICFAFAEAIIVLVDIEYNTRDKNRNQKEDSGSSAKTTTESPEVPKQVQNIVTDGPIDEVALAELNKTVNPLLSKLKNIGYELVDSKITKTTTYWRLNYTSNESFCEFNSVQELQDFAKNF